MSTTYGGANTSVPNLTLPSDGDNLDAASVLAGLQGLADRTTWLRCFLQAINSGAQLLSPLLSGTVTGPAGGATVGGAVMWTASGTGRRDRRYVILSGTTQTKGINDGEILEITSAAAAIALTISDTNVASGTTILVVYRGGGGNVDIRLANTTTLCNLATPANGTSHPCFVELVSNGSANGWSVLRSQLT